MKRLAKSGNWWLASYQATVVGPLPGAEKKLEKPQFEFNCKSYPCTVVKVTESGSVNTTHTLYIHIYIQA